MTNPTTTTAFSAADAALGYLYQVRLALLLAVQRLFDDDPFALYLETLDDLVFDTTGSPLELLQLKHHCERAANLTDASPDLWKSLRVWIEGRRAGQIPADARLLLVTTTAVGAGSAAASLQADGRDEDAALARLFQVARTSCNKDNQPAYGAFLALAANEQRALIGSVIVLPGSPDIADADARLRKALRLSVRAEHLEAFRVRLEGWWFRRAVAQLGDRASPPIQSAELADQIDDLREQFEPDALPQDDDILNAEIGDEAYRERLFVRQAQLAAISDRRILIAIRDYYRAFTQRSRWLREDLRLDSELGRYEKLLREEWEIQFARESDALGKDAAEAARIAAGQAIYAWVESFQRPIRPKVTHPSITRGSLHMLADELRIGWHPDFLARLSQVLDLERAA